MCIRDRIPGAVRILKKVAVNFLDILVQRLLHLLYKGAEGGTACGDTQMLLHGVGKIKEAVGINDIRCPKLLFSPGIAGFQRHTGIVPRCV